MAESSGASDRRRATPWIARPRPAAGLCFRACRSTASRTPGRSSPRRWSSPSTVGGVRGWAPHARPVPILGTSSRPGLLRGDVQPGPAGMLRVPSAAISVLDLAVSAAGIAAIGYYAQVPHYLARPYPAASIELLRAVGRHIGGEPSLGALTAG